MRLSENELSVIREKVAETMDLPYKLRLFGSRTDDTKKGGDIDLVIETSNSIERPAWLSSLIEARISRQLGGRKVDVLLLAPNLQEQPIHQIARATGVLL